MSQLTIYLDEATMKRVKSAARRSGTSVSRWAREHLDEAARQTWPAAYLSLLGSLEDTDLRRPPQPDAFADLPRERL